MKHYKCNICERPIYPNGAAIVCPTCGMRYFPIEGKPK